MLYVACESLVPRELRCRTPKGDQTMTSTVISLRRPFLAYSLQTGLTLPLSSLSYCSTISKLPLYVLAPFLSFCLSACPSPAPPSLSRCVCVVHECEPPPTPLCLPARLLHSQLSTLAEAKLQQRD